MDGDTRMIYRKCIRCGIKLRRTKLKTKRLSFGGGKISSQNRKKFYFCGKHVGTKSFMKAMWADKIRELVPSVGILF